MRLISEQETRQAIALDRAAAAILGTYRAHGRGEATLSTPSRLSLPGTRHGFGVKGAVLPGMDVAGARLTSKARSMILLWQLSSGEPFALIDESWLYRFRTGVSAAVVAGLVRPRAGGVMAVIGAGPIGRETVLALAGLCDPAEIRVAARGSDSAARLANEAVAKGLPVRGTANVSEAVRGADLVVTITTAEAAFLSEAMLDPDATVLSMGGGPELEHAVWAAAGWRAVDDLDFALSRGDAGAWIAAGLTDPKDFAAGLDGTIGDLAAGRIGAPGAGRAVAIVQGLAALDIALAALVAGSAGGSR